jgi:hypothetical protein
VTIPGQFATPIKKWHLIAQLRLINKDFLNYSSEQKAVIIPHRGYDWNKDSLGKTKSKTKNSLKGAGNGKGRIHRPDSQLRPDPSENTGQVDPQIHALFPGQSHGEDEGF